MILENHDTKFVGVEKWVFKYSRAIDPSGIILGQLSLSYFSSAVVCASSRAQERMFTPFGSPCEF